MSRGLILQPYSTRLVKLELQSACTIGALACRPGKDTHNARASRILKDRGVGADHHHKGLCRDSAILRRQAVLLHSVVLDNKLGTAVRKDKQEEECGVSVYVGEVSG